MWINFNLHVFKLSYPFLWVTMQLFIMLVYIKSNSEGDKNVQIHHTVRPTLVWKSGYKRILQTCHLCKRMIINISEKMMYGSLYLIIRPILLSMSELFHLIQYTQFSMQSPTHLLVKITVLYKQMSISPFPRWCWQIE